MTARTFLPLLVAAALASAGASSPVDQARDFVVSMDWLAGHLDDPGVVVIEAGSGARFEDGHIPGAGLIEHMATMTSTAGDHRLKPPAELAAALGAAGARDGARVVLYGDEPMETGWLFMAFASLGHAGRVSVLDGNLRAWRAAGHPVSSDPPRPASGTLTARAPSDVTVDATWVRDRLEDPGTTILDVRTQREWDRGRLPAATLVLWQDLYADLEMGRFKSREAIRALLAGAGARDDTQVVTYCAVGMRASLMYFAATYAGFDARVYVGSWSDWSARPGFPIVR